MNEVTLSSEFKTRRHKLCIFTEPKNFVQGVAFDPLNLYLASMSCDRSCRIFSMKTLNVIHDIRKMTLPPVAGSTSEKSRSMNLFHDNDTLKSFFRRLSFSPDGQLLVVPAGCLEAVPGTPAGNATYIFTRRNLLKPVAQLPCGSKASLCVRFCPRLFELNRDDEDNETDKQKKITSTDKSISDSEMIDDPSLTKVRPPPSSVFALPYRMVFAIATENSILLYDTQQTTPIAYLTNIHYHTLSDLTWSQDGRVLVVSSTDGYCTLLTFAEDELGVTYVKPVVVEASTSTAEDNQEAPSLQSGASVLVPAKNPVRPPASSSKSPTSNSQLSTSTEGTQKDSSPAILKSRSSAVESPAMSTTVTVTPRRLQATAVEGSTNSAVKSSSKVEGQSGGGISTIIIGSVTKSAGGRSAKSGGVKSGKVVKGTRLQPITLFTVSRNNSAGKPETISGEGGNDNMNSTSEVNAQVTGVMESTLEGVVKPFKISSPSAPGAGVFPHPSGPGTFAIHCSIGSHNQRSEVVGSGKVVESVSKTIATRNDAEEELMDVSCEAEESMDTLHLVLEDTNDAVEKPVPLPSITSPSNNGVTPRPPRRVSLIPLTEPAACVFHAPASVAGQPERSENRTSTDTSNVQDGKDEVTPTIADSGNAHSLKVNDFLLTPSPLAPGEIQTPAILTDSGNFVPPKNPSLKSTTSPGDLEYSSQKSTTVRLAGPIQSAAPVARLLGDTGEHLRSNIEDNVVPIVAALCTTGGNVVSSVPSTGAPLNVETTASSSAVTNSSSEAGAAVKAPRRVTMCTLARFDDIK